MWRRREKRRIIINSLFIYLAQNIMKKWMLKIVCAQPAHHKLQLHGNRFNLGQRQRYSGYMWYVLRTLDAHERVPSDISSKNTHHKPTVRCSQSRGVAEPVEARHRENNKYPKHETWSALSCRLSRFVKRKLLSVIAWNASDGRALVTQAAFNAARLRLSWRINKHQYAPFRDGLVSGVSKGDRQIMIVQNYI